MAVNTYRLPGRKNDSNGFFSSIEKFLRIDQTMKQVIHVRFLPQILFIATLAILYIANRHYAEKKVRSINVLEQQVEDLRADYTTLQAEYMFSSKQSEVARKAADLGLQEFKDPPQKILID